MVDGEQLRPCLNGGEEQVLLGEPRPGALCARDSRPPAPRPRLFPNGARAVMAEPLRAPPVPPRLFRFLLPRATRAGEESETRLLRAGCCVSTPLLCAQHRNTASRPARRELSARSCVLSVSHLVVQQMRRRSKRASGGSMDRTVAGRSCCSSSCRQTRACSASRTCCATASWLPCRPLYPRLSVAVCLQMSVAVCLCSRLLCVACTGAPLSSPSAA